MNPVAWGVGPRTLNTSLSADDRGFESPWGG